MGTPQQQAFKQIVLVRMPVGNQLVTSPAVAVKEVVGGPGGSGEKQPSTPGPPPPKTPSSKGDPSGLKPPKPPDKPLLPYVRFSRTVYERVKSEHPELKLWEIGKIIGQMWRDLPDEEKTEFVDKYKAEKIEYEKNYKAYLVSPAYLAYAAAKAKGETQAAAAAAAGTASSSSSGGTPQKTATSEQRPHPGERKAYIESIEDEEDSEEACFKHMVACARYSRNYRLIEDIFSESVVPSEPPVVTTARIDAYRTQIAALTKYVDRLKDEIKEIEEKFEEKKRKIAKAADVFEREMKRLRK